MNSNKDIVFNIDSILWEDLSKVKDFLSIWLLESYLKAYRETF